MADTLNKKSNAWNKVMHLIIGSIAAMILFTLLSGTPANDVVTKTLGSATVWQILIVLPLIYGLKATGATDALASWMMSRKVMYQGFINEAARDIPVFDRCDILVVGGGAAGHSAALAAARAGARDVVLLERYGYMGGDATGGYVIMVPDMTWYDKCFVRGIQEEWFTRLARVPGSARGPSCCEAGSSDPVKLDAWRAIHDCVSRSEPHRLVRSVFFEPNQLKIEMDKMLLEEKERIRVYCHCWGTEPIMDGGLTKGVIFESKQGRRAILAKVVIDATGDGDLFSRAGAPCSSLADAGARSSTTALVWRIGGVSWDMFELWKRTSPEAAAALRDELTKVAGFRSMPLASNQNDICWINNWHPNRDCTNIIDMTVTEMETRDTVRDVIEYLRKAVPLAFRGAYLYDIAPQLGCRCSRRLKGEYVMNPGDWAFARHFEDVIAWHSTICQINDCGPVEIPYRAILPQGIENMLCPGRHLSSNDVAIDWLNLIPQCVGTGQAAGVAAAVAIKQAVSVRSIDIKRVQDILAGEQDVPLPRNTHTDISYTECAEAHEYGLYTELAKKMRAEAGKLDQYRQW